MLPVFHQILIRENVRQENHRLRVKRKQIRHNFDINILPDERFIELFRVNKQLFQRLVYLLTPHLRHPKYRSKVTVEQKILTALRFYASGCYQRSVGEDFNLGISQTCVHRYIQEVTAAIDTHLSEEYIKFPRTRREINVNKELFMAKFNFPGIVGAVDGTHIAILKPTQEEHNFINRKGFHSINVQLVCDANLNILSVNANYPGSSHDSFIWRQTHVRNFMANLYVNGNQGTWLIGDSGYPLEPFLLTPFLNPQEGSPEARYNYHHASARNCVERCIGLLKARFQCLLKERVARYNPQFVGRLVNACATLHNMCINDNIQFIDELVEPNYDININPHIRDYNLLNEAQRVRNTVVERYFLNP